MKKRRMNVIIHKSSKNKIVITYQLVKCKNRTISLNIPSVVHQDIVAYKPYKITIEPDDNKYDPFMGGYL